MKLTISRNKFLQAVMHADRVSGKNLSLAILNNIYLEATETQLTIRSTNLDIGIEVIIPISCEEIGSLVVKGGVLSSILSNLNDDTVIVTRKNDNLIIQAQKSRLTVKGEPTEDYPTLPKVALDSTFTLPVEVFVKGLEKVAFSASKSDIKPEISSVYIWEKDGYLISVATDSFRLAEQKIKVKDIEHFPGVLIPFKNVQEITRILSSYTGELRLNIDDNQIALAVGNLYITSRVINGKFPDYQRIIPKDEGTRVTMLTQDLVKVLKMSQLFSDAYKQIDIAVKPQEELCTVMSESSTIGSQTTDISVVVEGEALETRANQQYIMDVVGHISSASIIFTFTDGSKPFTLRGVDDKDFLYIVMPMHRS